MPITWEEIAMRLELRFSPSPHLHPERRQRPGVLLSPSRALQSPSEALPTIAEITKLKSRRKLQWGEVSKPALTHASKALFRRSEVGTLVETAISKSSTRNCLTCSSSRSRRRAVGLGSAGMRCASCIRGA